MVLRIALRNFVKHWGVALLAILGTMVATMLLVGGLSLNDSVQKYLQTKIRRNLGKIDIVVKDKADTIFFPRALKLEKLEAYVRRFSQVVEFTPAKVAQVTVRIGNKYTDLFSIELSREFLKFVGSEERGAILSYDTAQAFGVTVGDEVEVITAKGNFKVAIDALGEDELNFRGETASANGTLFLPPELFSEFGVYPLKEPNTLFIRTNLPIERHREFARELEREGTIRVSTPKYRLQTSPLNRIIGYLFIGFSGFSVLSSFLFVSSFFGILTEERKRSLGVLRALGYSRLRMFAILFLEGTLYLALASTVGASVGVGFGRFLLWRINSFRRTDDLFAFVQDTVPFHVTPRSVILAVVIALIVPISLLIARSLEFSRLTPVALYSDRTEKLTRRRFVEIVLALLFVASTALHSWRSLLLSFLVVVPMLYRSNILSFTYGLAIILSTLGMVGEGGGLDFLIRAGYFLVGSVFLTFSVLPYAKRLFERVKSVPTILALAYIEKYKTRNFAMFLIYSVTLILILISAVVPHSIAEYIVSKKNEGAFGYNFIIIENPIKTFFGSYRYLRDKDFVSKFEKIIPLQLVQVDLPGVPKTFTFIVSGPEIFENLVLPSEELMRKLREKSREGIEDKTVFIAEELPLKLREGDTVELQVKGVLPGVSAKLKEQFNVMGTYRREDALLPMDGLIVWNRSVFGSLKGYAGVVRDAQAALEAQEFVTRKFDGAFYITGEIEKLYAAINNLVNMALQLFYIGFISGFAGLAIITFRNVYARRREIGMLRAIGSSGDVVFKIFLYEALSIVVVASVVASVATVFIVLDLRTFIAPLLRDFKIIVPLAKVLLTVLSVFGITGLFVAVPASLTDRVTPSEALRTYD